MKYIAQIMAALKVAWNEREELVEAVSEKVRHGGTAVQRYTLVGLLAILCMVVAARLATETEAPARTELASMSYEQSIVDEQQKAEAEKAMQIAHNREEAEYVAKVLYGTALHNSREGQETVVWCILNRVDDTRYPDDVVEVCRQEAQWVGYSDDNPVIESYYQMARRMLTEWRSGGHRPMAPEYVFAERTADSIILRSTYEITSRTRYYEA